MCGLDLASALASNTLCLGLEGIVVKHISHCVQWPCSLQRMSPESVIAAAMVATGRIAAATQIESLYSSGGASMHVSHLMCGA